MGSVPSSSGHSPSSSNGNPGPKPSFPAIPHQSLFLLPLPQRVNRRVRQVAESCPVTTSTALPKENTLFSTLLDPWVSPSSDLSDETDLELCSLLEHHSLGDDCPGDLSEDLGGAPQPCPCCDLPLGSCQDFIDCEIEIAYQVRKTGVPNQDGIRIPIQNRYLRPEAWAVRLVNYWDVTPIIDGLPYGWDLSLIHI